MGETDKILCSYSNTVEYDYKMLEDSYCLYEKEENTILNNYLFHRFSLADDYLDTFYVRNCHHDPVDFFLQSDHHSNPYMDCDEYEIYINEELTEEDCIVEDDTIDHTIDSHTIVVVGDYLFGYSRKEETPHYFFQNKNNPHLQKHRLSIVVDYHKLSFSTIDDHYLLLWDTDEKCLVYLQDNPIVDSIRIDSDSTINGFLLEVYRRFRSNQKFCLEYSKQTLTYDSECSPSIVIVPSDSEMTIRNKETILFYKIIEINIPTVIKYGDLNFEVKMVGSGKDIRTIFMITEDGSVFISPYVACSKNRKKCFIRSLTGLSCKIKYDTRMKKRFDYRDGEVHLSQNDKSVRLDSFLPLQLKNYPK